ncbi:MAG: hypothetical protein JKY03_14275 [Aureispira sp.]|nr:hypothetical protein [Aureispira sp.]
MTKKNSFIILVFSCVCALGQKPHTSDSTAILSYVDKIIIKANIDTQTDGYFILDHTDNSYFDILPNDELRFVLSLDYEFIGASIGYSPKFLTGNNDNGTKGESSFTDYSFRFFLGNWTRRIDKD